MSWDALDYARSTRERGVDLSGSACHVLLLIASRADIDGASWPSVKRLVNESQLSERTVQGAIRELVAKGVMERFEYPGKGVQYQLPCISKATAEKRRRLGERRICGGAEIVINPRRNCSTPAGFAPEVPIETTEETKTLAHQVETEQPSLLDEQPQVGSQPKPQQRKLTIEDTRFAEWWALYRRKTAKGAAEKAYLGVIADHARKKIPQQRIEDVLIRSLGRFEWGDDPAYYPYPATWLNQKRWDDRPPERKPGYGSGLNSPL